MLLFSSISGFATDYADSIGFDYKNIGKKVTYLEDKAAALDLSQVMAIDRAGQFEQGKADILNFGNSRSAFWVKINYRSLRETQTYLVVDAPNIEHIDCHMSDGNGGWKLLQSGCLSKPMKGVMIENHFVFSLPVEKEVTSNVIYLRLKTNNILMAPLKLSTAEAMMNGRSSKDRIEYVYIGVLVALLLFNFFLFISLKDITYFYYSIYVLTLSLYLLIYIRGYGFMFGDDIRIIFNYHPHVFLSLSVFTSLLFCRKFLNLDRTVPGMLKAYYFLAAVGLVMFFTSMLGYKAISASIAQLLTISVSLVVWISGVVAYRRGHKPAKYYILAWLFIWVTVGIVTLSLGGLIRTNEFTMQLIPIGSTIELLLLSFALGDRYRIIMQTEQVIRDENLMLVQTQNQRLEESVAERTLLLSKTIKELENSDAVKNKLFSIIAHDLRSPLNSLMSILSLNDMDALTIEDFQFMLSENKKNIETIYNTLNNLLHWAKGQMGGAKAEPEVFDLKLLFDELMLVYAPLMQKKQIEAGIYTQGVFEVYADKNQIRLILRNLIDNAIKFTPRGKQIALELRNVNEDIEVCVSNTVANADDINTAQLLAAGVTEATYGTENEKGVGLGLHLCREYIQLNGGDLSVQLHNEHITFSFQLPKHAA
ncbi:sensor histidine kinase [Pedobacter sp. BAL39]|uniref:sensor histidine kinase n=1 Tax=Pedobacter sp. BAL39 TaxID=391596 RepID=UPI0018DD0582|nr:sensor histidine kinase [Pedobacter sp. BAL39]